MKKVGVVGAGTMGFGISINFALNGYPTIISDLSDDILKQSMKNIKSAMALFVEEKLITDKQATDTISRITPTTDLAKLAANSDFVTEAIVERTSDKKNLFNTLDKLCPTHTIIASNTSGLVLSDFGSGVKRQDKIVVTHYFVPPHIVPGVEVVKGPGTSDETFNITLELMKKVRKIPVRVLKETPGFLMNRIQSAMRREVNRLWAEGIATAEDIELGITTTIGFRMPHEGSMLHYDLGGMWKWPKDIQAKSAAKQVSKAEEFSSEAAEKIRRRYEEGKPFFVNPAKLDEAFEKRDREYIRRLKALYWKKDRSGC